MTAIGFPAPLICLMKDCTAGSVRNRSALTAPPRQAERVVVLWIGLIRRLVDGERLGRLEIVLDGLDLTGLIESSSVRAPASRSALTDSASSGSSISSVASMAIRRLSSVGTVILP
jgi:hypothetical protein